MTFVSEWIEVHNHSFVTDKTEIVMMTGRRILTMIDFRVNMESIRSKPAVKYLGLNLTPKSPSENT